MNAISVAKLGEYCHQTRNRTLVWSLTALFLVALLQGNALGAYYNAIDDAADELLSVAVNASSTTVPTWHVSEPYINLWVHDQPLTYRTSSGESIGFGIAIKQRNSRPTLWNMTSLGPNCESSWLSFVDYTISITTGAINVGSTWIALGGSRQYVPDGVTKEFKSSSTMTMLTNSGTFVGFQINYPTGARDIYTNLYPYSYPYPYTKCYAMLTSQISAAGRTNRLEYDGGIALRRMIDYDGKTNTISYDGPFQYQMSQVQDPYGRTATFYYDDDGYLDTIVNAGGLTTYLYHLDDGGIHRIETPYGTTDFGFTTNGYALNYTNRYVWVAEPDGNKHLYLYRDNSEKLTPGSSTDLIPSSYTNEVPSTSPFTNTLNNTWMAACNSYYWGRKQYPTNFSGYNIANLTAAVSQGGRSSDSKFDRGNALEHFRRNERFPFRLLGPSSLISFLLM